jgi:hypothetical protein
MLLPPRYPDTGYQREMHITFEKSLVLTSYLLVFKNLGSVEILFFPLFTYSLTAIMRVTPTLPQRGRQPKGSIPLTPLFFRGVPMKIN